MYTARFPTCLAAGEVLLCCSRTWLPIGSGCLVIDRHTTDRSALIFRLPGDGVSPQAFYSWKRRYAGMGLNELRELREENRKLKTLVADLTLDKHILQEVLSKKA